MSTPGILVSVLFSFSSLRECLYTLSFLFFFLYILIDSYKNKRSYIYREGCHFA